jgi:hypothetical protein
MDITENEAEDGPSLPTQADEEFKPFIRRLPEFKFWYIMIIFTKMLEDGVIIQ